MTDVAPILEQRLHPAQLRPLRAASDFAQRQGVELYLVGGAVRDLLLGQTAIDLDLSVVGSGPDFSTDLTRELGGEVASHSQFGTSKVELGDATIDLAMARSESYSRPGALPTVAPGSIESDLARRDFSINALAVSLMPDSWGQLLDPHGGESDIRAGAIRVLHDGSFRDDATRVLRAIRYARRLGFSLESATEKLMARDVHYLETISGERVRNEVRRIFSEQQAASMLDMAQRLGVLSAIYPPLGLDEPLLAKLELVPPGAADERELLFLALLAWSMPSDSHSGFITRLAMDTQWAAVVRDTGSVRDAFPELGTADLRASQLRDLLLPYDLNAVMACAMATGDRLVAERLELYHRELRHVRPSLDGNDLIALGVPQGPTVGRLLAELMAGRLDGLLTSREDEQELVLRRVRGDTD